MKLLSGCVGTHPYTVSHFALDFDESGSENGHAMVFYLFFRLSFFNVFFYHYTSAYANVTYTILLIYI